MAFLAVGLKLIPSGCWQAAAVPGLERLSWVLRMPLVTGRNRDAS